MPNNYTFYDLNEKQFPEWQGILTGENYNNKVWEFINKNKNKLNSILNSDKEDVDESLNTTILKSIKENPNLSNVYQVTSQKSIKERKQKEKEENILLLSNIRWLKDNIDPWILNNIESVVWNKDVSISLKNGLMEHLSNMIYQVLLYEKNTKTNISVNLTLGLVDNFNWLDDILKLGRGVDSHMRKLTYFRNIWLKFDKITDKYKKLNNELSIINLSIQPKKEKIFKENTLKELNNIYETASRFDEGISKKLDFIIKSDISLDTKIMILEKYILLINEVNLSIDEQSKVIEHLDKELLFKESVLKINEIFKWVYNILDDNDPYDYEDDLKEIEELLDNTKQEYIKSWIFFKNIKDKHIDSLEKLKDVWIDYKKVKLSEMNWLEKNKIKEDLMKLYYDNYDNEEQLNFLNEIKYWLYNMLGWSNEVDIYMFYIDWKPILSSYFKEEKWEKYFWWFNLSWIFKSNWFGFWVLKKILEEQWQKHDINSLIWKKFDWKENKIYEVLKKQYELLWFEIWEQINSSDHVIYEMKRNKEYYNTLSIAS